MEQNMFAQTMPLFRTRPHCRTEVSSATLPRRHPALVAVGSACHTQRSSAASARVPPTAPFAPTYGMLHSRVGWGGQRPALPRFQEKREPLLHAHKDSSTTTSSERGAKLRQLAWEEQAARWELRYREQEKRVDLALSKPSHYASSPRGQNDNSECTALASHSLCRSPLSRRKSAAPLSSEMAPSEQPSRALFYVRDSELLRALQRAEARVRELEQRSTSPFRTVECPRPQHNGSHTHKRSSAGPTAAEVGATARIFGTYKKEQCSEEEEYAPLGSHLVVL